MNKRYIAYLKHVVKHKSLVLLEGRRRGVSTHLLLIHDWTKFLPDEFIPFAQCYYTTEGKQQFKETDAFREAQLKHLNRNKHHWQYWILLSRTGAKKPLPIPERYMREMIADWTGFSRNRNEPVMDWYVKNRDILEQNIHPDSFEWLDNEMYFIKTLLE